MDTFVTLPETIQTCDTHWRGLSGFPALGVYVIHIITAVEPR